MRDLSVSKPCEPAATADEFGNPHMAGKAFLGRFERAPVRRAEFGRKMQQRRPPFRPSHSLAPPLQGGVLGARPRSWLRPAARDPGCRYACPTPPRRRVLDAAPPSAGRAQRGKHPAARASRGNISLWVTWRGLHRPQPPSQIHSRRCACAGVARVSVRSRDPRPFPSFSAHSAVRIPASASAATAAVPSCRG